MITIYGSSDDLIEIEGDIREEFTAGTQYDDGREGTGGYLACSDGTLIEMSYKDDGIWHANILNKGSAFKEHIILPLDADPDGDEYSDKIILDGKVTWILYGLDYASNRKKK